MTLKESNKMITNNEEVAERFDLFFSNIVPYLNIDNDLCDKKVSPNSTDPVFGAIKKYGNRPSIFKIKEITGKNTYHFPFNLLIERKYSMNYKN